MLIHKRHFHRFTATQTAANMTPSLQNFTQRITVKAAPQVIYDILMIARKHAKLTGSPAKVSKKVGGQFEVYGGYAYGTNVELVAGNRIVQTWRAQEDQWPAAHVSLDTFDLQPIGTNKTRIVLTHARVPAALIQNFKDGWHEFYWAPLKAMFL